MQFWEGTILQLSLFHLGLQHAIILLLRRWWETWQRCCWGVLESWGARPSVEYTVFYIISQKPTIRIWVYLKFCFGMSPCDAKRWGATSFSRSVSLGVTLVVRCIVLRLRMSVALRGRRRPTFEYRMQSAIRGAIPERAHLSQFEQLVHDGGVLVCAHRQSTKPFFAKKNASFVFLRSFFCCRTFEFTFIHFQSLSLNFNHFHFHSFSFSFIHVHSLSFTFLHFHSRSFPFMHFHSRSFTYIHFYSRSFAFIHVHSLPFALIHFHPLPFTFDHSQTLSFTFNHFHFLSCTFIPLHSLSFTLIDSFTFIHCHSHLFALMRSYALVCTFMYFYSRLFYAFFAFIRTYVILDPLYSL